jgi:hypothetical protein
MRNRDGDDRLWGDAIDRFRRICELTLWLSGNPVRNSNVAKIVRDALRMTLGDWDDESYVVECFSQASERNADPNLYDDCYYYFADVFSELVPSVRDWIVKSILEDLDGDSDLQL